MFIRILLLLLILQYPDIQIAAQQSCYKDLRTQGTQLLKAKDYRHAIDKFFAARYCPDKPNQDDLDDLIHKAQDAWVAELDNARKEADTQRQLAQASLKRVNQLLANVYYSNKSLSDNDNNRDGTLYQVLSQGLEHIQDTSLMLEWRLQRADLLSNFKLYEGAIEELNTILQLKPDYLPAQLNRCVAYYYADRMEDCIRACDAILEHHTYLYIILLNKAQCLARLGKYQEAAAAMKTAQQHFLNGDAHAQYVDGNLAPDIEAATGLKTLYSYESAMRDEIQYVLLSYRIYQGDRAALREFEKMETSQFINAYLGTINFTWFHLKGRPQDYSAFLFAALLWEQAGYVPQAITSLNKFISTHKKQNDPRYANMIDFANKRLQILKLEKEKKLELPPKMEALSLGIQGTELLTIREDEAALKSFTHAIMLDPNNLSYRLSKLYLYWVLSDCTKVQEEAVQILSKWKHCTQALYYKARCDYSQHNDIRVLIKDLEAILQIDAYHTDTLEWLGSIFVEVDPAYALQLLQRYLQMIPNNQNIRQKVEALRSKN